MKKINTTTIIITILVLAAALLTYISMDKKNVDTSNIPPITSTITDPHDGTYTINEEEMVLVNGISYTRKPGATATSTTKYFGNDATGDIDGDGSQDTAFVITQSNGGEGLFYYLVAKLNKKEGVYGTYGYLLGDRINVRSISVEKDGSVTVNYTGRKPGENFSVTPSMDKSVSLKLNVNQGQFEVVTSGNIPTTVPSVTPTTPPVLPVAPAALLNKSWKWIQTTYERGTGSAPRKADRFVLTFRDSNFSATTDCNGIGGEYMVNGTSMTLDKMISTQMYCEGSQEQEYSKMLIQVTGYSIVNGELLLKLKDGGTMLYR